MYYTFGDRGWRKGVVRGGNKHFPSATEPAAKSEPVGQTYVLNTNTKKFHIPTCRSVKQMKDKNKKDFCGSREEVIAKGYSPCKNCNP